MFFFLHLILQAMSIRRQMKAKFSTSFSVSSVGYMFCFVSFINFCIWQHKLYSCILYSLSSHVYTRNCNFIKKLNTQINFPSHLQYSLQFISQTDYYSQSFSVPSLKFLEGRCRKRFSNNLPCHHCVERWKNNPPGKMIQRNHSIYLGITLMMTLLKSCGEIIMFVSDQVYVSMRYTLLKGTKVL